MIISLFLLLSAYAEASLPVDHKALFRLWERVTSPSRGEAEAIGSYSAGCLAGGERLAQDGTGYSVMRLSRERYYGHPRLVAYLENLGAEAGKKGLGRILVGDLGRARGGPMLSGHASHQSGLDVDIWYLLAKKLPSRKDREKWGATSYVSRQGKVTRAWTDKQRRLVELAAASDDVERIFVHAAIKKDLCERHPDAPWIAKLRPWYGHDDHLHVRLKCPPGSPLCEAQEATASLGRQCGPELDWWFSAEAKEELKKRKASGEREFPALPEACHALLDEPSFHAKAGQ